MGNEKERNAMSFGWISVVCLYERARTKLILDPELSEELEINFGMHQFCHFIFAVVLHVNKLARENILSCCMPII